ncbi:peptide N-acetyl-beta-D-glucosaminyl asparaginase amidase A-domain-containing protein [Astrocystis sublimbata]|nr:peptide N-acetyl-beta-D-glucosaminyl asparaginase amidase A-domain-containing protein [Astrocystis sublimbata]
MRAQLLLAVVGGVVLADPNTGHVRNRGSGAIHPYAKYKSLAFQGADTASSSTTPVQTTPAPTQPPLECFQVAEPVLTPSGLTRRDLSLVPSFAPADQKPIEAAVDDSSQPSPCAVVLMEHTFASSYGAPFVGEYLPPDCDFDHVVINFTTLVKGRQFDRTGVFYIGDIEVWRTSTAEPTSYGIRWEWLKDMTAFFSLWKQSQTLIFDLENNVDDTYTGLLNTTLTATFFKAPPGKPKLSPGSNRGSPADLIIPISQRLGAEGKPSQFVYPAQEAKSDVTNFPHNANRAVVTVDVKGQGNEEFWWSNALQSAVDAFTPTYGVPYPGYSPFREVQVLIDGHLAGVSWPFPVIYTGGVVPQLHRPIVGIQAFDILEHEIDVTPFLPLLCDGSSHTFEIKILGLVDDGASGAQLSTTTDDEWYVTGKVFVWLDDADAVTTGTLGNLYTSAPTIALSQSLAQNATGANETLEYNLAVSRSLTITSHVKTQKGEGPVTWTQLLSYSNIGGISSFGNNNLNNFSISGADAVTGPNTNYSTSYAFPLFANSTADQTPDGNLTLWAQVDQGLHVEVRGDAVLPSGIEGFLALGKTSSGGGAIEGSVLQTWRNGTADYFRPGDNSFSRGAGSTHQEFSFGGMRHDGSVAELYHRNVSAFNDTITDDHVEFDGEQDTRQD